MGFIEKVTFKKRQYLSCAPNLAWVRETSARAWCTGKIPKDQVEREVGEGIGEYM